MIHFFYANTTYIAVACPWRSVNVTGHTKFYAIYLYAIGDDVGDLNMTSDMLILGNEQ